jgi:arginase
LRDAGLLPRLGASDAGAVVPGRYDLSGWTPGDGAFNAAALADFSARLAARVVRYAGAEEFLLVLGGDCSLSLGTTLGLRRMGRYGLAYLDAHSDFRHLGNSPHVGAAAGECLALVTGRGQPGLVDLDGLAPYVRDEDVVVLGIRDGDEAAGELPELGMGCLPAARIRGTGATGGTAAAVEALVRLETPGLAGFWVHVDADVLDPDVLPAVDSPDPGGLLPEELTALLSALAASPSCVGVELTVFDPDLDPDGSQAALLCDILVGALLP